MTGAAAVLSCRAGGIEGRPKATDRWRTPPDLYARLDAEFEFTLDAACETGNCLAVRGLYFDTGRDGLMESWAEESGGGAVWCNPPYSMLRPWMQRGALEGRRVPVVMLVPADTSTRWWRDCVAEVAHEVRFKTKGGGGGLTTPSALVVYAPAGGPPRYSYIDARVRP